MFFQLDINPYWLVNSWFGAITKQIVSKCPIRDGGDIFLDYVQQVKVTAASSSKRPAVVKYVSEVIRPLEGVKHSNVVRSEIVGKVWVFTQTMDLWFVKLSRLVDPALGTAPIRVRVSFEIECWAEAVGPVCAKLTSDVGFEPRAPGIYVYRSVAVLPTRVEMGLNDSQWSYIVDALNTVQASVAAELAKPIFIPSSALTGQVGDLVQGQALVAVNAGLSCQIDSSGNVDVVALRVQVEIGTPGPAGKASTAFAWYPIPRETSSWTAFFSGNIYSYFAITYDKIGRRPRFFRPIIDRQMIVDPLLASIRQNVRAPVKLTGDPVVNVVSEREEYNKALASPFKWAPSGMFFEPTPPPFFGVRVDLNIPVAVDASACSVSVDVSASISIGIGPDSYTVDVYDPATPFVASGGQRMYVTIQAGKDADNWDVAWCAFLAGLSAGAATGSTAFFVGLAVGSLPGAALFGGISALAGFVFGAGMVLALVDGTAVPMSGLFSGKGALCTPIPRGVSCSLPFAPPTFAGFAPALDRIEAIGNALIIFPPDDDLEKGIFALPVCPIVDVTAVWPGEWDWADLCTAKWPPSAEAPSPDSALYEMDPGFVAFGTIDCMYRDGSPPEVCRVEVLPSSDPRRQFSTTVTIEGNVLRVFVRAKNSRLLSPDFIRAPYNPKVLIVSTGGTRVVSVPFQHYSEDVRDALIAGLRRRQEEMCAKHVIGLEFGSLPREGLRPTPGGMPGAPPPGLVVSQSTFQKGSTRVQMGPVPERRPVDMPVRSAVNRSFSFPMRVGTKSPERS